MKDKTIQKIGKVLLAIVVLLIVTIFAIWYIAHLVKQQELQNVENPTTQEQQDRQPITEQPSIRKLSTEELEEISDRLNTAKDNPFLSVMYQNPKEIKISELLYNGAIGTTTISNSEKMQITKEIQKKQLDSRKPFPENQAQAYLQNSILKLKRTDIEAYLKLKTGLEINVPIKDDEIGIYLEETDSYYQARTNTSFTPIFCDSGTFNPSTGIYEIEYHNLMAETATEKYVVRMREKDNEFVFVSNQDKRN